MRKNRNEMKLNTQKMPEIVMTKTQKAAFSVFMEKMNAAEQSVREQGYHSEEDVEKKLAQI